MSIAISVLTKPTLSLPYCSLTSADDSPEDSPSTIETFEVVASVVVKVTKLTKVTSLTASFVSQQFLQDQNEQRSGASECFFQKVVLLKPAKDGSSIPILLPVGVHKFEVKFVIPSWLPATTISLTDRTCHRIIAKLDMPNVSFNPFGAKTLTKSGLAEIYVVRQPPITLNAQRYWSGQRRSAMTSIALKTTRFGRVGGKLKISMRVKSMEPLQSCKIDLVQNETYTTDLQEDSLWFKLPGAPLSSSTQSPMLPFLTSHDLEGATYKKRKFPLPTISTGFPDPEDSDEHAELSATLSTMTLQFPLTGPLLRPGFESPLVSISHKVRIRIQFKNPVIKEVVVNIPVSLFEGSASCDDIPPFYEDIYIDGTGERRDSVATLPLYSAKDDSTYVADHRVQEARLSEDTERLLETQERNMAPRSVQLMA